MGHVPATEFKAKCLELMDRVAQRRESFVITKRGKPVARLVPVPRRRKNSIFGWLRERAWIKGDILGPVLGPDAWEALRESEERAARKQPSRRKARKPGAARRVKR